MPENAPSLNNQEKVIPKEIQQLENLRQKYVMSGENYAPASGDIVSAALNEARGVHEADQADTSVGGYRESVIGINAIEGENDGDLIVLIYRETRMNGGNGPSVSGHNSLYAGVKWLDARGPLDEKIASLVRDLKDGEETSDGNVTYAVHFVGRSVRDEENS